MTVTSDIDLPDVENDADARQSRFRRAFPVLSMIVIVVIGSVLPILRTANFYYWDDTAGAAVGQWQRIAGDLLSGQLPFLQLDMWRGGNFAAEAATGIWNPLMVAVMLVTHPFDDLATAITIAKIIFFVIGACGVYLLARGYHASRWMAALAGLVMPLSGWALFMNGSSWINEIVITALAPWAWWAIRRVFLRQGSPWSILVAAFCGYLVASVGDPYGLLALAVVFLALAVEAIAVRRIKELWMLIALGLALLLMAVVVYLPFVLTSSVGFRADSSTYNTEFLTPNLSDLLGLSTPIFKPYITAWGLPYLTFPGLYLAWFVLPMLPWLRWRSLSSHWRALSGVLAFGLFYLVFVLGPTQLGMFRWPARLLPFLYLPIIVIFVVIASQGLHRDRRKIRTLLSLVAIGAGAWMAYSDMPPIWKWLDLTTVIVVILGWLFLKFNSVSGKGFAILAGGMIVFLGSQLMVAPYNGNVANYDFPHSRSEMADRFHDRQNGLTVQVADYMAMPGKHIALSKAWKDMLGGNMYSVAGVESTTAYSGIGFTKLDRTLCMGYNGSTCPRAWDALWRKPTGVSSKLADLLRAKTVVVERHFADDKKAPIGWTQVKKTDLATVYRREAPIPFPQGRVSDHGVGVKIKSDKVVPSSTSERLTVSTTSGDRQITFARLAWPGYSATLNGKNVPVKTGPDGLLTLEVPGGVSNGSLQVQFTPPGLAAGLGSMIVGVLGVLLLVLFRFRSDRRSRARAQKSA